MLGGGQGTGKGHFARAFGSLFGAHFLHLSQGGHLVGRFNDHLEDKVCVFADEAFFAGDTKIVGHLKALITEPTLVTERKHMPVRTVRNVVHLIMASNSDWIVQAGLDDRRHLVLEIADTHAGDYEYFVALNEELDNGGREAMLHDLQRRDLSNFNVRIVPKTDALDRQKILSLEAHERWWFDRLMEGQLLDDDEGWEKIVWKKPLWEAYAIDTGKTGARYKSGVTSLGMRLSKLLPSEFPETSRQEAVIRQWIDGNGDTQEETKKVPHWIFPTLTECRQHFDKKMKTENSWPEDEPERESDDEPF